MNIDYERGTALPGFTREILQYDYDGRFIRLVGENDFRVSSNEQYITLRRGFGGRDDYALVIKDLKTLEDAFVLPASDIYEQETALAGATIGLETWSSDGNSFWVEMFSGAIVNGYIRIDTTNWTYDIFPTPSDILGGDALNPKKVLVTRHLKNIWIGIAELTEQERALRRQEGIGTELHIFNLETQESIKIDGTSEPLHYFRPQWVSDTELHYIMPDETLKTYTLEA